MGTQLQQGTIVEGRYRLEKLLGEGGYGAVWKAVQLNVNRPVAVKFLKTLVADQSASRRFEREARALGRLQHPNCVTMLDYGQGETGAFLVTEYLDGERLDHWAEGDHDLNTILHVAHQILAALSHAHQQRIVHRDLKPANIVVSENAKGELVVKVLDFGIASVVGAKRGDITKTGEVFGTPGYMAPEQLLGESNVGPTADLYSFGVVLYQMIEGRKVFSAGSGIEVALKHLTHDPPPMQHVLPDGLPELVMRLLSKQPSDRYQSAEEVVRTLHRIGTTSMEMAGPQPPPAVGMAADGPTPPTRPTGPGPGNISPMGQSPMGYQSDSSSGVRNRPPMPTAPPPPPDTNRKLVGVLVVLFLLITFLGVFALIKAVADEQAAGENLTVRSDQRASQLLRGQNRSDGVKVESLAPRARIHARVADAGHEAGRVVSSGCGGQELSSGFHVLSVMVGPLDSRKVRVYVPKGYDPETPHQVMLAIHDTNQSARELFDELNLGPVADESGVVIVFPQVDHPFYTWKDEAEWRMAEGDLEVAGTTMCLSKESIWLFGFGSGGYASQKLACEIRDVGAIVQSTYRKLKKHEQCEHSQIPYLFLAPMRDGRDPADGGPGCIGGDEVVTVAEHERIFREMYGCKGPTEVESRHDTSTCYTWTCERPFISCHIDGGRPLPGQKVDFRLSDCEGRAAKFPYRDKIWDFLTSVAPPKRPE